MFIFMYRTWNEYMYLLDTEGVVSKGESRWSEMKRLLTYLSIYLHTDTSILFIYIQIHLLDTEEGVVSKGVVSTVDMKRWSWKKNTKVYLTEQMSDSRHSRYDVWVYVHGYMNDNAYFLYVSSYERQCVLLYVSSYVHASWLHQTRSEHQSTCLPTMYVERECVCAYTYSYTCMCINRCNEDPLFISVSIQLSM